MKNAEPTSSATSAAFVHAATPAPLGACVVNAMVTTQYNMKTFLISVLLLAFASALLDYALDLNLLERIAVMLAILIIITVAQL